MELLAPAGSRKALTAAVQSGADAVYLGVSAVRRTLQCRKLYNRRNENVGGLLPFIRC